MQNSATCGSVVMVVRTCHMERPLNEPRYLENADQAVPIGDDGC